MKVLLEIDDEIFEKMYNYSLEKRKPLEVILTTLFKKYILDPTEEMDKFFKSDGSLIHFYHFQKILTEYLQEARDDLSMTINTSEEFDYDRVMQVVLDRLSQKHTKEAYLLVDLFKVYWQNK